MHDIIELDRLGMPGCAVATEEFRDAAAVQADAMGVRPAVVFVDHPIQNRTPEELTDIAERAIRPILAAIRSG
ncbi:MAG: hypothetical protein F4Y03_11150 [Alphaproteobacteria bacterium]|nr:hypothetical protein [Alphaproteobacteria bacterium]MYE01813.1 hypothetical protein [Alphaproteobacteria bacterium]